MMNSQILECIKSYWQNL